MMTAGEDDDGDLFAGCDLVPEHADPSAAAAGLSPGSDGLAPGLAAHFRQAPEAPPAVAPPACASAGDDGEFEGVPLDEPAAVGTPTQQPANRMRAAAGALGGRVGSVFRRSDKGQAAAGQARKEPADGGGGLSARIGSALLRRQGQPKEPKEPPAAQKEEHRGAVSRGVSALREDGKRLVSGVAEKLRSKRPDIHAGMWCSVPDRPDEVRAACRESKLESVDAKLAFVGMYGRVDNVDAEHSLAEVIYENGSAVWWPTSLLVGVPQQHHQRRQAVVHIKRQSAAEVFGLRVVPEGGSLVIDGAVPGTPAAACIALAPHIGGLLTHVDGAPVGTTAELVAAMKAAGNEVAVTIDGSSSNWSEGASARAKAVGESLRQQRQVLGNKLQSVIGKKKDEAPGGS